jgi:hypothetical protein
MTIIIIIKSRTNYSLLIQFAALLCIWCSFLFFPTQWIRRVTRFHFITSIAFFVTQDSSSLAACVAKIGLNLHFESSSQPTPCCCLIFRGRLSNMRILLRYCRGLLTRIPLNFKRIPVCAVHACYLVCKTLWQGNRKLQFLLVIQFRLCWNMWQNLSFRILCSSAVA